ncbi:hypothetical protein [Desmospora activa]|uniref:Uncharacterized protein n=1 Tax=Desmospora activa DSM 45169 TaxID=1121389 RepID=A0A2T4Z8C2_9BACL|nr:hypothetical protein [Desmospora activa]PTM58110.1 hypothetical protein C8J48_0682 [Desmospora activa DSM 45169]
MWSIIGVLVVAAVLWMMEWRHLPPSMQKERWVFAIFMLVGTSLNVMWYLGWTLPNPADWLTAVYRPIIDWTAKVMG